MTSEVVAKFNGAVVAVGVAAGEVAVKDVSAKVG